MIRTWSHLKPWLGMIFPLLTMIPVAIPRTVSADSQRTWKPETPAQSWDPSPGKLRICLRFHGKKNDGFHGKITSGMGETSYFMGFMGQPNWFPVPMFHSTNPYQSIDSWISWILRPNNWYLQYRWRLQDFVLFVPVLLRFHIHLCVEPPVWKMWVDRLGWWKSQY